jgi:hypothetical protein
MPSLVNKDGVPGGIRCIICVAVVWFAVYQILYAEANFSHESIIIVLDTSPGPKNGDFLAATRLEDSPTIASDSTAQTLVRNPRLRESEAVNPQLGERLDMTLPKNISPKMSSGERRTESASSFPQDLIQKSHVKSRKEILQEWQLSFANRGHRRDDCLEFQKASPRANVSHESGISAFQLQTSVGQGNMKIPRQVVLTGHFPSLRDVFEKRRDLLASLGITPDLTVRYFNDHDCRRYLSEKNPELVKYFDAETHGSYRGDMCRTSVLAQEGGFYIDLDMQLRTPLTNLVDDHTSFMTAISADSGCLNALMATVPNNPVLHHTLARMSEWYSNKTVGTGLLGPETLRYGVESVMNANCPWVSFSHAYSQVDCGDQALRFFQERALFSGQLLGKCSMWGPIICPDKRAMANSNILNFGLFDGNKDHEESELWPTCEHVHRREKGMIGWSRYEDCDRQGCGLSNGQNAGGR